MSGAFSHARGQARRPKTPLGRLVFFCSDHSALEGLSETLLQPRNYTPTRNSLHQACGSVPDSDKTTMTPRRRLEHRFGRQTDKQTRHEIQEPKKIRGNQLRPGVDLQLSWTPQESFHGCAMEGHRFFSVRPGQTRLFDRVREGLLHQLREFICLRGGLFGAVLMCGVHSTPKSVTDDTVKVFSLDCSVADVS